MIVETFNSTTKQWNLVEANPSGEIDNSTLWQRTANTYAVVTGMTITGLAVGKYVFITTLDATDGLVNGNGLFAYHLNGTAVTGSPRNIQSQSAILGLVTLSSNWKRTNLPMVKIINITATTDTVTMQGQSVNGEQISVNNKTMTWFRI